MTEPVWPTPRAWPMDEVPHIQHLRDGGRVFFGKPYHWITVDGRLVLQPGKSVFDSAREFLSGPLAR